MERQVFEWAIARAFQFFERRAQVIQKIIDEHRAEFGSDASEPSIDAICVGIATLTALAKYRFEDETPRYPEQFRKLLRECCPQSFTDRVSIPELSQNGLSSNISKTLIDAAIKQFPPSLQGSNYLPQSDPTVDAFLAWLSSKGLPEPGELWHFFHSYLIYEKYRNPVMHSLRIADGAEPWNMWLGAPDLFYANRIVIGTTGASSSIRLFGVMDSYFVRLIREGAESVKAWCLREGRWVFR